MKVLQFPLARITLAFIAGLLFAYFFKLVLSIVLISLSVTSIIFLGSFYLSRTNRKFQLHFGIAVFLLALSIGVTTQTLHTDSNRQNNYTHYKNIFDKKHSFTLTLREKLKSNAYNDRYVAIINSVDNQKVNGRILLNINKDSLKRSFVIGSQLKINTLLYQNTPKKNPNQFDYSKYLENKQIYAQLYAEPNEIQVSAKMAKDLWYYSSEFRTRIIQNLKKSKFNDKE